MAEKYSMDQVESFLSNQKEPEKKEEKKLLKGRVEFSPEQEMTAQREVRDLFPQKEDNPVMATLKTGLFPVRQVAKGAFGAAEDLENLALAGLQLGQPTAVTYGDLMRQLSGNDAGLTDNELNRTQAYQEALAKNQALTMAGGVGRFAGGIGLPLGSLEGFISKIPLEIQAAAQGVPALAKIGKLGQEVPIVQDVAQTVARLKAGANMSSLETALKNPLIGGAATGAGYGAAFGTGQHFGEHRNLPGAEELGSYATGGAALGTTFGAAQKLLANAQMMKVIQDLASKSPLASMPEAAAQIIPDITKAPDVLHQLYKAAAMRLEASGLSPKEILSRQEGLVKASNVVANKVKSGQAKSDLGDEAQYAEKSARLTGDVAKMQMDRAKVADRRSYGEGQKADNRAHARAEKADNRAYSARQGLERMQANLAQYRQKAAERQAQKEVDRTRKEGNQEELTAVSDETYRTLFDEIDRVDDIGHLAQLEKEIHSAGVGPEGKPILRGHQRSDLMAKLGARRRELRRREASESDRTGNRGFSAFRDAELGENRVAGASRPEPGTVPQNKPEPGQPIAGELELRNAPPAAAKNGSKTASKAGQTKAPSAVPKTDPKQVGTPKYAETDVKTFLLGAFRKTLNVAEHGNRENRYKLAVSVDALADEAGLGLHETTALKRWVSDLSDVRAEITYKDLQIERLVKWADENESVWVGQQDKVKHSLKQDQEGNAYRILEHAQREGRYRRMALTYKMQADYEKAMGRNVEFEVAAKPGGGEELRPEAKPQIECVTCGTADDAKWETNLHGGLTIQGGIKPLELPNLKPPKSADELFERMERLMNSRNSLRQKLRDIKAAKVTTVKNPQGEPVDLENYQYLGKKPDGDPVTVSDVMQKAFEALKLPYVEGKAPDTRVWHVDQSGHVSTVAFKQPRDLQADTNARLDAAEKLIGEVTDKSGKIDYDAIWASDKLQARLFSYFPGLGEVAILSALFRKQLHTFGRNAARASGIDTIFAGTIDDILRDNTRFGGDLISDALHNMLGEINHNFLTDRVGEWHKIESPEALSELINEFKGVPAAKGKYRQRAVEETKNKVEQSGSVFTQADKDAAIKRADTALMIRSKSKVLADRVQEKINEMKVRKADAQSGKASPEGKKFYTSADLNEKGEVLRSAYNPLFAKALEELHNGLTLQPSQTGNPFYGFAADTASRVSMSIMRNNPSTAIKNFFDQAPMTLAYFHKHFFQAVHDLHTSPALKEAIERLPVIPQADMSNVQLQERLRDQRPVENLPEKLFGFVDWINGKLQSKVFDPVFGGKSPLVSFADRNFAKYTALASLYKSAEKRGLDRNQFVSDLISGKLRPEVAQQAMSEMSLAISQTLNSVRPDLNKDLFASSLIGKILSQYATPGRRAMKLWSGWIRDSYKGDPSAALKLLGSFAGMVAFGGRGAVPASISVAYLAMAGMSGNQEKAEKNLQALDQFNLLDRIGIDWSGNFGPDWITNARPALEALEEGAPKLVREAQKSKNTAEFAGSTAEAALDWLALLPSIGPFGYQVWRKAQKKLDSANQGYAKQYFEYNGTLRSVVIPDYTYPDALRDWMFGGYNPKVSVKIREQKINAAKKADAKFRANKDIMPVRETNSQARNTFQKLYGGSPKSEI